MLFQACVDILRLKWIGCCTLAGALLIVFAQPSLAQNANSEKNKTTEDEIVEEIINQALRANNGNGNSGNNSSHSCAIVITEDGSFGTSVDNSVLSSKLGTGRSGKAQVATTRGSYRVSIDTPLGFTNQPAGELPNYTMLASMSGNGATSFAERPGTNSMKLKKGLTNIEANLEVSTTNGQPFTAGNYSSQIILRCE